VRPFAGFLITKEKIVHQKDPTRQMRSYRTCWLPAQEKPLRAPPRESGAYVPEMATRLEDDRNLTDGARRCARKLAEYVYRRNRDSRAAEITVTWLMKALRKSRRSVQRYLRELERAGYISVAVIHAGTRMCAGLMVELLATLIPRHGWPQKLIKPDAPKLSQKHRFRNKTRLISRVLWAVRCTDPIRRAWDSMMPPLTPFPAAA
jgi:DNA-binding transcriptional ArsR family regulator